MDPDLGNARGAGGRAGRVGSRRSIPGAPGSPCSTSPLAADANRKNLLCWKRKSLFVVGKCHPGSAQRSTTRGGRHCRVTLQGCPSAGDRRSLRGGKAVPCPCFRNFPLGLRAAFLSLHSSLKNKGGPSPTHPRIPGADRSESPGTAPSPKIPRGQLCPQESPGQLRPQKSLGRLRPQKFRGAASSPKIPGTARSPKILGGTSVPNNPVGQLGPRVPGATLSPRILETVPFQKYPGQIHPQKSPGAALSPGITGTAPSPRVPRAAPCENP